MCCIVINVCDLFYYYFISTPILIPLSPVIQSKPKFILEMSSKKHLLEVKKKVKESWLYLGP